MGDADAAFDLYDCFHEGLGAEKAIRRPCTGLRCDGAEPSRRPCLTWPGVPEGGLVEKNEDLFMY
ncbi:MAG: hypothetical protein ACLT8E_02365 [Akkermansia sp.]